MTLLRFALGSNVRDAACYVVWTWGRAYEAADLTGHIDELATQLVRERVTVAEWVDLLWRNI